MVTALVERGELSPEWRPAFEQVARHRFIPDIVYRHDESAGGPDLLPVRRADDPEGWLARAYANSAVQTQVDEGQPDEQGRGRELTSSASQPAVVAEMLTALRIEPGMRVLEIGTGTGYNAALLAHRVGAENVVSVEVDAALAEHARKRLAAEGFGKVTVITGDGTDGWADGAPYDRVIATVAARQVPYPWVAQTRPGGEVLVPWTGSEFWPASLLRLVAGEDGTGSGRIVGSANFMPLRSQRRPRWGTVGLLGSGDPVESTTDVHPYYVAGQVDAATAIGFRVPGVRQFYTAAGDAVGRLNLTDQETGSWARVQLAVREVAGGRLMEGPPYAVEQAGPRRLWDEVIEAYQWWQASGRPAIQDWRITVTPRAQCVELVA